MFPYQSAANANFHRRAQKRVARAHWDQWPF
jgi:hypothetical protein